MKRCRVRFNSVRFSCPFCLVAMLAAGSPSVWSEVPRKPPLGSYAELWNKSPFTVPPVVAVTETVEENPLEDYTLAGVCEMEGGWFVVLMNKKNPKERIRLKPNEENAQGFKVKSVNHGTKSKEAKVEVTHRGKSGWVSYDDKFLVAKRGAQAAPPIPGAQDNGRGRPPIPGPLARGRGDLRGQPPIPGRPGEGAVSRVPVPPAGNDANPDAEELARNEEPSDGAPVDNPETEAIDPAESPVVDAATGAGSVPLPVAQALEPLATELPDATPVDAPEPQVDVQEDVVVENPEAPVIESQNAPEVRVRDSRSRVSRDRTSRLRSSR